MVVVGIKVNKKANEINNTLIYYIDYPKMIKNFAEISLLSYRF